FAAIIGTEDRRVAGHAGEDGHLAEARSGRDGTNFPSDSGIIAREHVQLSIEREVEGVSAPVAFAHDGLTGRVRQQPRVRTNLFAAGFFAFGDHLQVVLLLVFEKFRENVDLPDRFEDCLRVSVLSWHSQVTSTGGRALWIARSLTCE